MSRSCIWAHLQPGVRSDLLRYLHQPVVPQVEPLEAGAAGEHLGGDPLDADPGEVEAAHVGPQLAHRGQVQLGRGRHSDVPQRKDKIRKGI